MKLARTTIIDREMLPGSGCKIASFNARFYAIDHLPQL
jgi:hypothetical protein